MFFRSADLLVADARPLDRVGIAAILSSILHPKSVLEADDFPALLETIRRHQPIALLTIDTTLPRLGGSDGLKRLRIEHPDMLVLVIAAEADRDSVLDALRAGVHGYLPKASTKAEMVNALRLVASGRIYVPRSISDSFRTPSDRTRPTALTEEGVRGAEILTKRQIEVVRLVAAGRSNKEIARALAIAEGTVKVHVAAAFRTLGVHNRVGAATVLTMQASPSANGMLAVTR